MPRFKKPIKDIGLVDVKLIRTVRIDLTPETYAAILELSKSYVAVLDMRPQDKFLTYNEALSQAKFWVSSGSAPDSVVSEIKKRAFCRSKEGVEIHCLETFLVAHPTIKVLKRDQKRGIGRPHGMSPEAKQRLALGLAIADLVNDNPSSYYRKLKVA